MKYYIEIKSTNPRLGQAIKNALPKNYKLISISKDRDVASLSTYVEVAQKIEDKNNDKFMTAENVITFLDYCLGQMMKTVTATIFDADKNKLVTIGPRVNQQTPVQVFGGGPKYILLGYNKVPV